MAANFSFEFLFAPVKVNRRFHDGDGMINFRYLVTILTADLINIVTKHKK